MVRYIQMCTSYGRCVFLIYNIGRDSGYTSGRLGAIISTKITTTY